MVIAFLIALLLIEIVGMTLFMVSINKEDNVGMLIIGWVFGAFTSATGYVLFYQIFPSFIF